MTKVAKQMAIKSIAVMVGACFAFSAFTFVQAHVPTTEVKTAHILYDVGWSPDSDILAVGDDDGIRIYDESLQEIAYLPSRPVASVSWSPDGVYLAGAGGFGENQGTIYIWRRDTSTTFALQNTLENQHYEAYVAVWSPDGTKVATVGRDVFQGSDLAIDTIEIWDTEMWTRTLTFADQYRDSTFDLEWSPNSQYLAVGGTDYCDEKLGCPTPRQKGYFILDTITGERVRLIPSLEAPSSLSWSSDGRLAVDNPEVTIYDPASGQLLGDIYGSAYRMQWRPDNVWLATGGRSGTIYLSNVFVAEKSITLQSADTFFAFDWRPDGNRLVTVAESGVIQIWDTSNLPDYSDVPTITPFPKNAPAPTPRS